MQSCLLAPNFTNAFVERRCEVGILWPDELEQATNARGCDYEFVESFLKERNMDERMAGLNED
jgi:hypothetical protein